MNTLVLKINRLFKTGFFHVFGSNIANNLISFFTNVFLVNILTKSEYGIFISAWNIYSIAILANGLGMNSGLLQLCSENSKDERLNKAIFKYAFNIGMAFDLIIVIVLLGIGSFVNLSVKGSNFVLCLLSFLPLFQLPYILAVSYLRAQKQNEAFSYLSMFNTVAILVFTVLGALLFKEKGMVIGYYIAYFVSILYLLKILHKDLIFNNCTLEKEERKSILSISTVSMFNNGISELMYLLDIFVLGIVLAKDTVLASYKVSTTIPSALTFVTIAIVTYVYPYFAEHRLDCKWCLEKYKKLLFYVGSLNGTISLIMFVGAPYIITLLYGEKYSDAVIIFQILSINYFFSGTFRILAGNILVTQRELKFNFWVAILSGIINIIADVILIQNLGSIGAALATVLIVLMTGLANTIYLFYVFKRNIKKENDNDKL